MLHNTAQIFLLILLNILSASCTRNSSLTFVIDDTGSMWNNIQEVKLAAKDIMTAIAREKASEIADVVLVTFNDPGTTTDPVAVLRKKTINYNELKNALDGIKVHTARTNNDCEEYSLTGIELALRESRPNSYLFVFTDAPAKDFKKLDEIKRLCEKKQSQVTFILTGNCGKPYEKSFLVYHEIARISAGQVFTIPKEDVEDVLKTIEETVKGKKTVLSWILLPPSFLLKPIPFEVDDKTDYVIVSTSGLDVELKVTKEKNKRARKVPHETLLLNRRGKVVKINGTPGTYYAWVRGDTDVTVVIYARTDFTFEHGFSEFMPKSMEDVSKLPIAGRKHYLSISVTDPEHTVRVRSAQIVDMHNKILYELPLKKATGNFYITDAFISPSTMFKIKVIGTTIETGQDIQRTSKTAFEPASPPQPKPKIPVVVISEGRRVKVDFGKDTIITCTASGYPVLGFLWTSENGRIFNTKSYIKEEPYDYISYLKLSNVQRSDTYRCKVANNDGQSNSTIEVIAGSPFKITPSTMSQSETTKVEYGAKTKLRCDIKSEYPMEIKWNTPLKPADYELVDGGKEMIIRSVNMQSQGKYSCEAVLKTGAGYDDINHTITTNVVISNLKLPSIDSTSSNTTVKSRETAKIKCKISAGVPPAIVSWKVRRNGDDEFRDIFASGEVLLINMTLANAGLYKCIARNPVGSVEKDTEIIVHQAPETTIDEIPNITVPYLAGHEFTCRIIAKPLPSVTWTDAYGTELTSTKNNIMSDYIIISKIKIYDIRVNNTFYCHAENSLGKSVNHVNVTVLSPFLVTTYPPENTVIHYGASLNIVCDIKSSLIMKIKWFHQKSDKISDLKLLKTSDKYAISSDGTTLNITKMDMELAGKYTCEAYLQSNHNEKISYTTNVRIDDLKVPDTITLESPSFNSAMSGVMTVLNGEETRILCKVSSGMPPANVSWYVRRNGDDKFRHLTTSSEELIIRNITLADAGLYKCIAKNPVGAIEKDTEIIVNQAPNVTIDEAVRITIPYGSDEELTCRIVANPLPSVSWKDGDGNELLSANITTNNNNITSKFKINNIKANKTFYCLAENCLGKTVKYVNVTVLSPFVVSTHPIENSDVHYGTPLNIVCDIKSLLPMKIEWFHQKSDNISDITIIHTSDKYVISPDGMTLNITDMDMELAGKYTCEASLESDENEKISYTTNVRIDDLKVPDTITLESPSFNSAMSGVMTVLKGEITRILCKVSSGVPPANVSWYVKRNGDDKFRHLTTSSEELIIRNITLADAGLYKCIAKNPVGAIEKDTEIIVNQAPNVTIDEAVRITIPYGSDEELTCRIVANPLPSVSWKDGDGNELLSANITTNNNNITSKFKINNIKANKTFYCLAENSLGKSVKYVNVTVLSPFVVSTHPIENSDVHYGTPLNIVCDIKSLLPMKIEWFHQKSDNISDITIIHTSDKYVISPDGMTLNITDMDMELAGKYTCEASLESDENEKISYTTNVRIDDLKVPDTITLESPSFNSAMSGVMTVLKGEITRILCKVSSGVPPANVSWYVRRNGDDKFRHLTTSSEELIIRNITLADAGLYKCIAKNPVGAIEKDTEIIVNQAPEVTIDEEAGITIPYGSNEELTCRIVANPQPSVSWKDGHGNELLSTNISTNNGTITSKFKINNIKANKTFSCHAENSLGKSVNYANVTVLSPFVVSQHPKEIINVHYGAPLNIVCDIKSLLPMKIEWFYHKSDNILDISTVDKNMISSDGETLNITSMNLELADKYTCEASLESDENEKISYTTNVWIDDLSVPDLIVSASLSFSTPMPEVMTLKSGETFKAYCKISAGIPPPSDVSWQVYKNDDDQERQVPSSGGELIIENITLADAGFYTCTTYNSEGLTRRVTEVIVNKAPESTIDEISNKTIAYGSNQELRCTIIGHPLPTVTWTDKHREGFPSFQGNYVMRNDTIISKVNIYNITADNLFSCHAENSLGKSMSSVNITVSSPFVVSTHPTENTLAQYKMSLNITCGIASSLPMKIKWFHQKSDKKTDMIIIQTSDMYEISLDGQWLHIIAMDLGLTGKYTCEATLESNKNETISYTTNVEIDGLSAPSIANVYPGVFKGVTGDKVLLILCDVDGFPEPIVTWKSMGKVVTSDAKITVLKNELFIHNPTEEDSNNFTCEAVNELGNASKEFTALISDFINIVDFLDYWNTIYLVRGESKDIQCNLSHADPQEVRWFLRGEKTDKYGLYPIKNASLMNDGNYTCRVNTDKGSFSENYVVDVGYEPRFLTEHKPEIDWFGDEDDTLDCSVSAKPIAETEWYYNGKALGKSQEIFITGSGNYSCKATNAHGSVSRTMRVTHAGCIIKITNDSIQKQPLLIYDHYVQRPYYTRPMENEHILFYRSEVITLVCATEDQPNNTFITHPTEVQLDAECIKQDKFLVQGIEYRIQDLQCEEVPYFETNTNSDSTDFLDLYLPEGNMA